VTIAIPLTYLSNGAKHQLRRGRPRTASAVTRDLVAGGEISTRAPNESLRFGRDGLRTPSIHRGDFRCGVR
jgi:hypothetical protein